MSRPKGVLFTDIDGTWLRWSLFLYVIDELLVLDLFPHSVRGEISRARQVWRDREGDYDEYMMAVVKIFEVRLRGLHESQFDEACRRAVDRCYKEVYCYPRQLIKEKQDAGWLIVALSASPEQAVKLFCRRWGVSRYEATIKETMLMQLAGCGSPVSVFTGDRYVMKEGRKAETIDRILSTELVGMSRDNVWALGDTMGDIPMLERAGRPICVNPSSGLMRVAVERGWLAVIERKDVITEIENGRCRSYRLHADGTREWLTA